jgi:Tfp pilus assembly protein FimT
MRKNSVMRRKDSAGLTIMELIITLAVLGTLIALASPLINQFSSGYKLRGAAREVATDLQFARLLAVKENNAFQVVINSNSYQVVRVSDGLVTKSRSFIIDYPDVTLTPIAVTFNSRGNSSSSTITVSNPMGTKNITVGSTGRVKLG